MPDTTFYKLAETAQRIAGARNTDSKINVCANYFRSISNNDDLNRAAWFIGEGAFPTLSEKKISIGSRTISTCAADFCGISYEQVFKPSKSALGSASETIEKLMHNIEAARNKRIPQYPSLAQIEDAFEKLYRATSRAHKQKILRKVWTQMTPIEIKYFIRILRQSSLRIGFETRSVISAIAEAFNKDTKQVRYVHMITGSIGKTAVLSKNNDLDKATFKLFHPLSFMLASPLNDYKLDQLGEYVAEEKFDGMRCQAHIGDQHVELYSWDLNDVTHSFPEVVQFFLSRRLPDLVLDGEICLFREDEILPFQLLKKRLQFKKTTQKVLEKYPALFISCDVLYCNDQPVFEQTLTERRLLLETMSTKYSLPIANQFEINSSEEIERLFERALRRGNEGLILKKKNSTYEYGQRRESWLKMKQPGGTLNTVIMYAHGNSGKRAGNYSDFTLGIRVKEDERYEEEFIPIGKICGGLTDREMKELSERIKDLAVEKYGPTLGLIPEIVVEIEFDDIQINKRTKANYKLRLPHFKAIHWGLASEDVDTLKDVERIYEKKINRKRLKQDKNPSFLFQAYNPPDRSKQSDG